jgi:hypothetical protein
VGQKRVSAALCGNKGKFCLESSVISHVCKCATKTSRSLHLIGPDWSSGVEMSDCVSCRTCNAIWACILSVGCLCFFRLAFQVSLCILVSRVRSLGNQLLWPTRTLPQNLGPKQEEHHAIANLYTGKPRLYTPRGWPASPPGAGLRKQTGYAT